MCMQVVVDDRGASTGTNRVYTKVGSHPRSSIGQRERLTGVGGDSTVRWARQLWRRQAACGRLRTVLVEKATSPSQRKGGLPGVRVY